jgi:hypothetical protein
MLHLKYIPHFIHFGHSTSAHISNTSTYQHTQRLLQTYLEVAAGRARATGEETVRGRASGATGEENGERGGEACSVDGEVCSGDGEGACSGDRRGDGEGRASGATGEENGEGGGEACSGNGEAQATRATHFFGSISHKRLSKESKLLSLHPLVAFKLYNLKVAVIFKKNLQLRNKCMSFSIIKVSNNPTVSAKLGSTSIIISSSLSLIH